MAPNIPRRKQVSDTRMFIFKFYFIFHMYTYFIFIHLSKIFMFYIYALWAWVTCGTIDFWRKWNTIPDTANKTCHNSKWRLSGKTILKMRKKYYLDDLIQRIIKCKLLLYYSYSFSIFSWILGFHTIPRGTNDNRYSGYVGVPNKRNNQNYFVKSILQHGCNDVRWKLAIHEFTKSFLLSTQSESILDPIKRRGKCIVVSVFVARERV